MTLLGPKRAFGKGERREQNAVIKVYSANELKVALTKVYGLPNGVGTIQIAGDITITEPIKLRQFLVDESAPREIIIQSVGGARIYNGNKTTSSYSYNQTGNNEIPVFDFGKSSATNKVTRYTFKDLIINNDTSRPFGSFIAVDLAGTTTSARRICLINISNIKLNNVWNVFASYDSTGTFFYRASVGAFSARIDGLTFRNTDASIISFNLNNFYFSLSYGVFSNITVWNNAQKYSTDLFNINTNYVFVSNVFQSISAFVNINPDPRNTAILPLNGSGNVITGCEIANWFPDTSFALINCTTPGTNVTNIFPTTSASSSNNAPRNAFQLVGDAAQADLTGTVLDTDFVTDMTVCFFSNGAAVPGQIEQMRIGYLQDDSNYEINWHISAKLRSTNETNIYHIKTNAKVIGGVYSIVSNTTVSTSEEFLGLTGLTPTVTAGPPTSAFVIDPTVTSSTLLDVACVAHIKGFRVPAGILP